MPYGLPKEMDTASNNFKMERCVQEVMSQGRSKGEAVRICKAGIIHSAKGNWKAKEKKDKANAKSLGPHMEEPDMEEPGE